MDWLFLPFDLVVLLALVAVGVPLVRRAATRPCRECGGRIRSNDPLPPICGLCLNTPGWHQWCR
jgi:hypothetical protein